MKRLRHPKAMTLLGDKIKCTTLVGKTPTTITTYTQTFNFIISEKHGSKVDENIGNNLKIKNVE